RRAYPRVGLLERSATDILPPWRNPAGQLGEIDKIPAHDGERLDRHPRDYTAYFGLGGVDERNLRYDLHHVAHRAQFEREVGLHRTSDSQHQAASHGRLKTRQ